MADLDAIPENMKSIAEQAREAIDPTRQIIRELNSLFESSRRGSLTLRELETSVKDVSTNFTKIRDRAMEVSGGLFRGSEAGDKLMQSLSIGSQIFDGVSNIVGALSEAFMLSVEAMDMATVSNREVTKSMFEQTSAFGLGLDAAKKFGVYITQFRDNIDQIGFVRVAELEEAMRAMTSAGIPLERMSDTITSTAGSFDLLTTAVLQSKAIGMDLNTYMSNMSDLMNKQGLSTQSAAEQMSMFGELARSTGFRVSDVATNLQTTANNFSKLGMSVNFGKGILEGFTNSLKSMGLGFENALDLSSKLSNSIAGLASNYAMAYVTFQRGGLDINTSGTALGASIGMRAEMLEAEKRGDQGAMGMQIAGAIKDTIASFTGGEILTVTEARENPALEGLYYTQTKLLESMYGISDIADQDRTLELLKQLNDATASGDTDLAESIGRDIEETINMRDDTLGVQEKIEAHLNMAVQSLYEINENIIRQGVRPLEKGIISGAEAAITGARNAYSAAINLVSSGATTPGAGGTAPTSGGGATPAAGGGGGSSGGGGGGGGGGTAPTTTASSATDLLLQKVTILINQMHIFLNGRQPT